MLIIYILSQESWIFPRSNSLTQTDRQAERNTKDITVNNRGGK
jgi:hypothetical protein